MQKKNAPRKKRPARPGVALAAGSLLVAFLAGCRSAAEPTAGPLPVPPVSPAVRYFAGTPLSGPLPLGPAQVKAEEGRLIRVSLYALESVPEGILAPLGSEARRIVASSGGSWLRPTLKLLRDVRVGTLFDRAAFVEALEAGALGRSVRVGEASGIAAEGATCAFYLSRKEKVEPQTDLEIQLYFEAGRGGAAGSPASSSGIPRVAVVAAGLLPAEEIEEGAATSTTGPAPRRRLVQETAVLEDSPAAPGRPLAVFFPSPYALEPVGAFAAILQSTGGPGVDEASGAEHAEAVKLLHADLGTSAAPTAARLPREDQLPPGIETIVENLAYALRRRRTLLFLASATGAFLANDIALSASDAVLSRVYEEILKITGKRKEAWTRDELGIALDGPALKTLAGLLASSEITPDLEGFLDRRAGQVGRQASSIERVLQGVRGLKDLEERLVQENLVALEDTAPSARARALRWLEARGLAPAGYDPLASAKERRVALERAFSSASTEAAKEGAKP